MLTRLLAVLTVAGLIVAFDARAVFAGDATGSVQCEQGQAPGCTVTAGTSTVIPSSTSSVHPQAGVNGRSVCKDFLDKPAPCTDAKWGWMGSDGCYWKVDTGYQPPSWDTADQHAGQSGAWFLVSCTTGNFPGSGGGVVWLPTTGGAVPLPPPAVLARQAMNRLRLAGPNIATSPPVDRDQLVNVPTWLWLDGSRWASVSATASVPGESATATATPMSVTWTLGDGSTVVCRGPGTPYAAGGDPSAPSPDCGHTYRRGSAGRPGGAFVVSAMVSWGVRWVGGGKNGTLPALTTTSTARLRVGESQAINTAGTGA